VSAGGIPTSLAGAMRAGLLALGGIQAATGLYALAAPRSFYDGFPLGRAWVAALPDYNEHLVRDVGGLFLGIGFVLIAAGWLLERRLVIVALVGYLAFSVPHTLYHLFNLEPYEAADVVANVVTLAATVLLPLGLLYALHAAGTVAARPEPEGPPGR
jgi:hypothetical protein